jgi:hypothetical protein
MVKKVIITLIILITLLGCKHKIEFIRDNDSSFYKNFTNSSDFPMGLYSKFTSRLKLDTIDVKTIENYSNLTLLDRNEREYLLKIYYHSKYEFDKNLNGELYDLFSPNITDKCYVENILNDSNTVIYSVGKYQNKNGVESLIALIKHKNQVTLTESNLCMKEVITINIQKHKLCSIKLLSESGLSSRDRTPLISYFIDQRFVTIADYRLPIDNIYDIKFSDIRNWNDFLSFFGIYSKEENSLEIRYSYYILDKIGFVNFKMVEQTVPKIMNDMSYTPLVRHSVSGL